MFRSTKAKKYNNGVLPLTPRLKIGHWNIEGLVSSVFGNKCNIEEVKEVISSHDIIGLTETHIGDSSIARVDGYKSVSSCRNKHNNANNFSGGISIFIKEHISRYVNVIKSESADILWVKIPKSLTNDSCDLYVAFVYISPRNSTYSKTLIKPIWESLASEISKFQLLGHCIILGDLNARVGHTRDFIEHDEVKHIPIPESYQSDDGDSNILRFSQDLGTNDFKQELIDLCISARLRILNGRMLGDSIGNFTCHKYNGSSVVDYCLTELPVMKNIKYFKVGKFHESLSDHCPITVSLRTKIIPKTHGKPNGIPAPYKPKWDNLTQEIFIRNINSETWQTKMKDLIAEDLDTVDLDKHMQKISSWLTSAAGIRPRKNNKHCRKKKHKKWYTRDCESLKARLKSVSRTFLKDPYNRYKRDMFFQNKRAYNKLIKKCKHQFRQNIINKLEEINEKDPQEYWKLVEQLKEIDLDDKVEQISAHTFKNHYKSLLTDSNNAPSLKEKIENLINEPFFNELDYVITRKEIADAVRKVKLGKAVGIDNVSGEMLRCSRYVMMDWYEKTFNHMYRNGGYPRAWSLGIITSLFKAGDPTDPNNYRGLTINSCLGKIYGIIMNERLKAFVKKNKLIRENQIGFKQKARTTDHIFVLKLIIDKYGLNKSKRNLHICFIDFKKAYDSVWHDGLILKLLESDVRGCFIKFVQKCIA